MNLKFLHYWTIVNLLLESAKATRLLVNNSFPAQPGIHRKARAGYLLKKSGRKSCLCLLKHLHGAYGLAFL